MAKRDNHYESAFEAFLRKHRVAYVAVDEKRRSLIGQGSTQVSIKNLDFIVSPSDSVSLPLDVKGRRFPSGQRNKQYWRNWSTWDDLESLARWQEKFSPGSCALLVFAFHVVGERSPVPVERLFEFRQQWYAFLAVRVADYIQFARPLSTRWRTVAMPVRLFRQAAFSFDEILSNPDPFAGVSSVINHGGTEDVRFMIDDF
jgi:hypothetical protein